MFFGNVPPEIEDPEEEEMEPKIHEIIAHRFTESVDCWDLITFGSFLSLSSIGKGAVNERNWGIEIFITDTPGK